MKNIILIIFISFFSGSSNAQELKKNVIKSNPVLIVFEIYNIEYERVLNTRSTFQIGLGIGKTNNYNVSDFQKLYTEFFENPLHNPQNTQHSKDIFSINLAYRLYKKDHKAPKGLYVGPAFQYTKFKERLQAQELISDGNYSDRLKQRELDLYNFQIRIGYQFNLVKSIVINPYVGPSFIFGKLDQTFRRDDENLTGFGLNYGVEIGLAF